MEGLEEIIGLNYPWYPPNWDLAVDIRINGIDVPLDIGGWFPVYF